MLKIGGASSPRFRGRLQFWNMEAPEGPLTEEQLAEYEKIDPALAELIRRYVRWHKPTRLYRARKTIGRECFESSSKQPSEAARKLIEKLRAKLAPEASLRPITLQSWKESYLADQAEASKGWLSQVHWWWGHVPAGLKQRPLLEIEAQDVQPSLNALRSQLAPASLAHLVKVWRRIYQYMLTESRTRSFNAMEELVVPRSRVVREPVEALTLEQFRQLYHVSIGTARKVIVLTGLLGLGYEEIRGIRPGHYDHDSAVLWVAGQKTDDRPRKLPIPPALQWAVEDPIIPPNDSSISKALNRTAAKIGHKKTVGRNVLRHTFATLLYELDAPEKVIDALLGHAIKGTKKVYVQTQLERQKAEWLNALCDLVLLPERVAAKGS